MYLMDEKIMDGMDVMDNVRENRAAKTMSSPCLHL
jgi:hypothetical protein